MQLDLKRYIVEESLRQSCIFISANYRLLIPSSVSNMMEDVQSLFSLIRSGKLQSTLPEIRLNTSKIICSGSSAGGLLALLSATHLVIPPSGILCMYSLGGASFTPQKLVNEQNYFGNRDVLEAEAFQDYLSPLSRDLEEVEESEDINSPRKELFLLHQQKGILLDAIAGEPGLSETVRSEERLADRSLFPMLATEQERAGWPSTLILHGSKDDAVPPRDSIELAKFLGAECLIVEGGLHNGEMKNNAIWLAAESRAAEWMKGILKAEQVVVCR